MYVHLSKDSYNSSKRYSMPKQHGRPGRNNAKLWLFIIIIGRIVIFQFCITSIFVIHIQSLRTCWRFGICALVLGWWKLFACYNIISHDHIMFRFGFRTHAKLLIWHSDGCLWQFAVDLTQLYMHVANCEEPWSERVSYRL